MTPPRPATPPPRASAIATTAADGRTAAHERVRAHLTALLEALASRQRGARLPSQMELAKRFSTSARVINHLIAEFSRRGLVFTRPGLGVFLMPPPDNIVPAVRAETETGAEAARGGVVLLLLGGVRWSERNWVWPLFRDIEERLRMTPALRPVSVAMCAGGAEAAAALTEKCPAGLALMCTGRFRLEDFPELAEWLHRRRDVKTVHVSLTRRDEPLQEIGDLFCLDDFEIGRMALDCLASFGHRRVAMFGTRASSCPFLPKRRDAFLDAARRMGVRAEYVEFPDLPVTRWSEAGAAAGAAWVENRLGAEGRPTGVFCTNDEALTAFLRTVEKAGFAVPRDVSLIGVDNDVSHCLSTLGYLPTTIDLNPRRIAPLVAARLRHRFSGQDDAAGRTIQHVAPDLVVRGTTGAPPTGEPPPRFDAATP